MKKGRSAGAFLLAVLLGIQVMPLQEVWASQVRVQETEELMENALADLSGAAYAEGEALISIEAAPGAALAQEGVYRYDK